MKRIITLGSLCLAVLVFFTGCSSLTGSVEVDVTAIQSSVEAEEVTDENGENLADETRKNKEVPDYFQHNLTEKFKGSQGKQAFHIKDGHSREPKDIEAFQIGAMKDEKTFVYGYVTRMDQGAEAQEKMVHCGAFYNYDTEKFQVFHENVYAREGEEAGDQESFFIQADNGGGDIFVYDNGEGYIYDQEGNQKFHGNMEAFIRRQFQNVHSVSVINALTDGQNRIYIELSIEKEEVQVPKEEVPASTEEGREDGDEGAEEAGEEEGKLDEEAEKLDKEVDEKTDSLILVYEYQKINSGMDQENEAFEKQKNAWIAMTEGQEFETKPGGVEDWKKAVGAQPDSWGSAYLGGMDNTKVYRWKEGEKFILKDGICTFKPEPDSYENFRDVKENWQLENLFIPVDKNYSCFYGRTKTFRYYNPESIERIYTLVWYEDEEKDDGTTIQVKHSQRYKQRLHNIYTKRYALLENAYIESYRVMDRENAVTLGRRVEGQIQCTGKDRKVRWIQSDGKLADTPYEVTEDTQAGAFADNGQVYYIEYGQESMTVVRDASRGGDRKRKPEKIEYKNLAGSFESGDSPYDAILENKMEEDVPGLNGMYGYDYYTEDQVLPVELNLDLSLAAELRKKGDQGISRLAGDNGKGFLMTSREKGLIFYSPSSGLSQVLESGAWFGTWKAGENYVSVGFLNGESSSYGSLDVAFARVYEYNLSRVCNESMEETLREIQAQEEADRQEESRQEEESDEEETEETTKNALEQWNEEYQNKYTETYPKNDESGPPKAGTESADGEKDK